MSKANDKDRDDAHLEDCGQGQAVKQKSHEKRASGTRKRTRREAFQEKTRVRRRMKQLYSTGVTSSQWLSRPARAGGRRGAQYTQRRRRFPRRLRQHGIAALPRLAPRPQGLGHRDRHVVGEPRHDPDRFTRYLSCLSRPPSSPS